MESIIIPVMIVTSVGLILYALLPKKKNEADALLRRMTGKKVLDEKEDIRRKAKESARKRVVDKIAPMAMRPVMPKSDEEMSVLKVKLASAGYRQPNATRTFLASKTVLGLVGTAVTIVITIGIGYDPNKVLCYTIFAGALAFMFPNYWLRSAITKRGQKIREGLPDALDLMVVSVEAGLGLDAAIQRVGQEMGRVHPALAEEFQIVVLEGQVGLPRAEALANLAVRAAIPEVKSLVAVVTQAEKFGTSIAKALRNQADSLRTKRRQAAEEKAQATTVKLMIPLVLFIFPAMFVVLAGPAAIRIYRTFQ